MIDRLTLKTKLKQSIFNTEGKIATGKFKSLSSAEVDAILFHTVNCQSTKLSERIYWILHDLVNYPVICGHPNCSKPVRFKGEYRGKFCSHSCNSKFKLLTEVNPLSGAEGSARRKAGMKKKHGVDHNMKLDSCLSSRRETYMENYGVDHPLKAEKIKAKVRASNESTGAWMPKELMGPYYRYRLTVMNISNKQDLKSLPNYELRGPFSDDYSLDHKFSCKEGFLNNIPPYIIGSIANLEFIKVKDNSSKGESCSITVEELFDRFDRLRRNYSSE
jgi:hypothetical protein